MSVGLRVVRVFNGSSRHLISVLGVGAMLVGLIACSQTDNPEAFQCVNDGDCPPGCACENDFVAVGVCEASSGAECAGSCDRETMCPAGSACMLERTEGEGMDAVEYYSCQSVLGDLGASCQSNGECDPNASSLGAFCCLDAAKCGANLNQCIEDCSTYSSGGIPSAEGGLCQDNTECDVGLFCCLVPDAAGNCDFEQDQSCTCRTPS